MDDLMRELDEKEGANIGRVCLLSQLLYRKKLTDEMIIERSLIKLENDPEMKRFDYFMHYLVRVIGDLPPDHPQKRGFYDRYLNLQRFLKNG